MHRLGIRRIYQHPHSLKTRRGEAAFDDGRESPLGLSLPVFVRENKQVTNCFDGAAAPCGTALRRPLPPNFLRRRFHRRRLLPALRFLCSGPLPQRSAPIARGTFRMGVWGSGRGRFFRCRQCACYRPVMRRGTACRRRRVPSVVAAEAMAFPRRSRGCATRTPATMRARAMSAFPSKSRYAFAFAPPSGWPDAAFLQCCSTSRKNLPGRKFRQLRSQISPAVIWRVRGTLSG